MALTPEDNKDAILEQHLKNIKKDFPALFSSKESRAELKTLLAETIETTREYTHEAMSEVVMENMQALAQQSIDCLKDEGLTPEDLKQLASDPTGMVTIMVARAFQTMLKGLELVMFEDMQIGEPPEDCHDPECAVHNSEPDDALGMDLMAYGKVRGEA